MIKTALNDAREISRTYLPARSGSFLHTFSNNQLLIHRVQNIIIFIIQSRRHLHISAEVCAIEAPLTHPAITIACPKVNGLTNKIASWWTLDRTKFGHQIFARCD